MDHSELIDRLGGTAAVARRIGAQPASVPEWLKKRFPDSRLIELGAEIHRAGIMPRWDLRPTDWHRIWPELIGTDGAPDVPAEEVRDAA